jgi:anti-anti-sigma factor
VLVPFVAPDQFRLPMQWRVVAHIDVHTIKATAVVKVDGDLDAASVADLIETVASLMRPTCTELTIDLSGSRFISAGALQELDEFIYGGSRQGRGQTSDKECIHIYGLSRTARRVIDVAALRHIAAVDREGQFDEQPSVQHPCYLGELTVVWHDDRSVDISLVGEFDIANDANVRAALDPVADGRPARVRLHTSQVTFAASSTLGLLVWLHRRITSDGGAFEISDTSPSVRRLLDVTGANVMAFSSARHQHAS